MKLKIVVLCLIMSFFCLKPVQSDDLNDGYWNLGYWTPGLITWNFYNEVGVPHFYSRSLYQNQGVMDETAALNGVSMEGVDGFIALMSPAVAGWKAWIKAPETVLWIPTRVADVVAQTDYYFHVWIHDSALELSWELSERLGNTNHVNADGSRYLYHVEVCLSDGSPEIACAGEAHDFREWFVTNARFVPDLTLRQAFAAHPEPGG